MKDNDVKLAIAAYHRVGGERTYRTIASWLSRDGFEVGMPDKETKIVYARKKARLKRGKDGSM